MMFWIAQGVGLLTIIFTVVSLLQKEKFKMMIWLSLTNVSMIAVYLLLGRLLGALLVCGALARTLIYFFFNVRNKQPDAIVPVLFGIYYVVISIVMWNSWIDLLMVLNVVLVTYVSWQNNPTVFRIGYIMS